MTTGRSMVRYLAWLLVLALALSACERPLARDEATSAPEGAVDNDAAMTDQDATEGEAEVGEGAIQVTSEPEEAAEDEAEAESPRPDESESNEEAAAEEAEAEMEEPASDEADGSDVEAAEEMTDEATETEAETGEESAEEAAETAAGSETEGETEETGAEDVETDEAVTESEEGEAEGAADAEQAETAKDEVEGVEAEEPAAEATDTQPSTHTVGPGENLYRIGLQYGTSWVVLAQYNNLANPNFIYPGQVLAIPGEESTPSEPSAAEPAAGSYYTIQPGDNLYRIGLKYGVSWVEIAEANGIVNPNQIYAGQVLKIPSSAPGPSPEFTHVVQPGETLYRISLRYGVPWLAIAQANSITSPYVIYAGQTLIIPGG